MTFATANCCESIIQGRIKPMYINWIRSANCIDIAHIGICTSHVQIYKKLTDCTYVYEIQKNLKLPLKKCAVIYGI